MPSKIPSVLPDDKSELVALVISQGVPSYEAWDLTVPQLKKLLKKEG